MASDSELETFVQKFRHLWKSGLDAQLNLEAHAGEAWVGLHLRLGQEPGPLHRKPQFTNVKKSPSARDRRRELRAADRAASEMLKQEEDNIVVNEPNGNETEIDDIEAEEAFETESSENNAATVEEACDVHLGKEAEINGATEDVVSDENLEEAKQNKNESMEDVIDNSVVETKATIEGKEEPEPAIVKPPEEKAATAERTVFATFLFENAVKESVTEEDVETMNRIIKSKDHLCRNVGNIFYRLNYSEKLRSGHFEHRVQAEIIVMQSNLWEPAKNYIRHHLGRDEWKLRDGTTVSLRRIHEKT